MQNTVRHRIDGLEIYHHHNNCHTLVRHRIDGLETHELRHLAAL